MNPVNGNFFDGKSSKPLTAVLTLTNGQFQIQYGETLATYNANQATPCPAPTSRVFSIEFSDGTKFEATPGNLSSELLQLDRSPQKKWEKHWRQCSIGLLGIASLIFLSYWFVLPNLANQLASKMPDSIEQQISGDFDKHIARMSTNPRLATEEKLAAASKALQSLYPEQHLEFKICCTKLKIANAFALPGGKIYATEQLIEELSPDELTAVLLHEVGHIYYHHPMRVLIENRLFSAAIIMAAGYGDAYGWGGALMSLSHSREYEKEADIFAGQALKKLGRSPGLLAQALEHIEKLPQTPIAQIGWLSTHPITSERKKYLEAL